MRFCDFFSGVGGFRLGLERAGHVGVWACEIDDFCRKIYAQHFEEPQGKDINDVKPNEIPEAELWCGGFPCQDLSVAGKRGGLQANRSGLYWTWYELIRKRQPPWLLIENVPGLLSSKGGADFALILSSLDGIGYGVAWRVLDAQFFGLAQQRKRVFIVGCFGKPCPPEILFEREGSKGDTAAKREAGRDIAMAVRTCVDKGDTTKSTYIVGTLKRRHDGSPDSGRGNPIVVSGFVGKAGGKTRSIGYKEEQCPTIDATPPNAIAYHENIGGHTTGDSKARALRKGASHSYQYVTAPPNANGMREVAGLPRRLDTPDSPRYKALGNAVAVPVVEWIGRRLPK